MFVGCCFVYSSIIYFFYPYVYAPLQYPFQTNLLTITSETKQQTLESIAAAFGDHIVSVKDDGGPVEAKQNATTAGEHIE